MLTLQEEVYVMEVDESTGEVIVEINWGCGERDNKEILGAREEFMDEEEVADAVNAEGGEMYQEANGEEYEVRQEENGVVYEVHREQSGGEYQVHREENSEGYKVYQEENGGEYEVLQEESERMKRRMGYSAFGSSELLEPSLSLYQMQ
ncbi:hypothetical protein AX15_004093 [Amanita polypyramis BW_CC]|nr:hypothetical protein AX15_004093 [Amanita polypyramis BW_CC]